MVFDEVKGKEYPTFVYKLLYLIGYYKNLRNSIKYYEDK